MIHSKFSGFESSVNANNARRQLAVNKNAQWYGTGTGTARKDGVPGTPLGVIGVRSYGHSAGYGGHAQTGYGGGHAGYGSHGGHAGAGYGRGYGDRHGNSYHQGPNYQAYGQGHSQGYGHQDHYSPKYGYGFNNELSKSKYSHWKVNTRDYSLKARLFEDTSISWQIIAEESWLPENISATILIHQTSYSKNTQYKYNYSIYMVSIYEENMQQHLY